MKKSIVKLLEERFPGGKWVYNTGLKSWLNKEKDADVIPIHGTDRFTVSFPGEASYEITLDQSGTRTK